MAGFKGEANGNARLTEAEVRHIRWLLDTKKSNAAEIARLRGLNAETVRRIGRRETWAWVADLPPEETMKQQSEASVNKLLEDPIIAAQVAKFRAEQARQAPSAAERMAEEIRKAKEIEGRGDKLLDELTGEKDGKPTSSK